VTVNDLRTTLDPGDVPALGRAFFGELPLNHNKYRRGHI
jgi:hypothetical protein